ncbi:MAG: peptidylprolyl isomerase [Patescibacteria group bacterium]
MQKKYLFSIALSSLILAGCSSSVGDTSSDISLSDTKDTSKQTNSKQLQIPTEAPMKKLADFEKIDAKTAVISTNKGEIEVELYPDMAPVTVASFLSLIQSKFYDGVIVHRVEPGFVIQVGDPKTKEAGKEAEWGTGGPGYTIPDEFSSDYKYDQEGILAMAKTSAPNSGGSQFFITLGPAEFLNGSYTVFGKVTKGMDVVKNIAVGDKITTVTYK